MKRIPDNSGAQLRRNTLVLSLLIGLLPFLSGCGVLDFLYYVIVRPDPPPSCADYLGECPPPDTGVKVNEAGVLKSVWIEDDRIGEPEVVVNSINSRTFCIADVDPLPGDELVFRGRDGLLVISSSGLSATAIAFIPRTGPADYYYYVDRIMFHDIDGDGHSEFLFNDPECELDGHEGVFEALLLRDHSGSLIWQRCVDYIYPGRGVRELGDWARADINDDGVDEFAVTTGEGVELIDADGSTLGIIGDGAYSNIAFADVDDDGSLELVTQVRGGEIVTWDLDGAELGSFVPPDPDRTLQIGRAPAGGDRDFIVLGCEVYDIDGALVATIAAEENGRCNPETVDYGAPLINTECPSERLRDFPENLVRFDELVRFATDRDPYRAEITYSIDVDFPLFNGPIAFRSHRTILRIYDPSDEIVYHEVIATESNPGSFLVIPSDVPGEEVLLVADGTRIVAYFLGEMNQRH